jgi:hypothetical protein
MTVDNQVISQISRGLMVLVGIGSGLLLWKLYLLDFVQYFDLQSRRYYVRCFDIDQQNVSSSQSLALDKH